MRLIASPIWNAPRFLHLHSSLAQPKHQKNWGLITFSLGSGVLRSALKPRSITLQARPPSAPSMAYCRRVFFGSDCRIYSGIAHCRPRRSRNRTKVRKFKGARQTAKSVDRREHGHNQPVTDSRRKRRREKTHRIQGGPKEFKHGRRALALHQC